VEDPQPTIASHTDLGIVGPDRGAHDDRIRVPHVSSVVADGDPRAERGKVTHDRKVLGV
jgi:hypothetical protein